MTARTELELIFAGTDPRHPDLARAADAVERLIAVISDGTPEDARRHVERMSGAEARQVAAILALSTVGLRDALADTQAELDDATAAERARQDLLDQGFALPDHR